MPSQNSPLLLKELDIPGRSKEPVSTVPIIWGIGIAAALGNFPLNGLLCQAGPWGNMAVGDKLTIFWGTGENVWVETVDKTEVGTQLRMFVPSQHMADGSFAVSYVVKPLGGADEPSEVMQVLVKLTRPGGHDDNGEIGHSKLIMTIPKEIVDGGIDKDNVAAGVPITLGKTAGTAPYPYAAAGDVCRISWGGIFVFSEPLTQEQAEGKAPVLVTITEAVIREAGDADSPGVAVAFEVYDKVLNRSEDWSPEQRIVVAVDATRLDAPILKEAKNNELDLDALAGKPGTAQVPTSKSEFELGDIIIVRVKGTPTEGAPIDFNVESKPLDNLPSVVELELPNAALMQLATKTFSLSCSVKKADSPPHRHSKSQFITAIGEVQRLAAPIMLDEDSGALDPALPQIRLEIPFDKSFAQGQVLKIFMLGTRSDLKPYLPDLPTRLITRNDVVDAKPLLYNIDGKHLAPVNGGTAEFYYQQLIAEAVLATLNPYEATRAIRESIHTEILQVGEPRLELPEPEVAGVVDGVLPADTAGTTLTVVYIETVAGDEVFIFWIGSITGEYPDSIKLNEFTAGQPVPFPIGAELIKGNEGGTVEARYEIKRAAGGTSYSNSLVFGVGREVEDLKPEVTSVKDSMNAEIPHNGGTVDPVVTLTGTAAPDQQVEIFEGAASKGKYPVDGTGTWRYTASLPSVGTRTFKAKADYGTGQESVGRTFTYSSVLTPVITSVQDSKGAEIPNNTVTLDPNIKLTGTATSRLHVEIFDGATSKGTAQVSGSTGKWELELKGLSLTVHEFTAKALYGTEPVSAVRTLTVTAATAPTLTSVKGSPSGNEIPQSGNTVETAVTLSGIAAKGQQIEAFDGATSKGKATADTATGKWELRVIDLNLGAHSFKTKALYGDKQESGIRTFTTIPIKPSIKEASGNSLNPFAAKDHLTMLVPRYTGMASTDKLSVTWTGAAGTPAEGSHTSTAVDVGTVGAKEIPIPNKVVAFNLGKAVTVFYTVIRNGTPTKSEEFALNVQTIPNEDSRLPNPIVNANTTTELNVITLPADAKTRIAAWALIKQGQKLWMRYFAEGNPTPVSTTYNGASVPAGVESTGMYPNTPVNELKALANGARLRIEFKVGFDGSNDERQAVTFPSRTYTVKKRVTVSGAEDFERERIREFVFNTPARFGSGLSVTPTNRGNGRVGPGVYGYSGIPKPPTFYYLGLLTANSAITRFEVFAGPIKAIRFLYEHASYGPDSAIFFDDNGQVIETKYLTPYNGTPVAHIMEFNDDRLAYFELHSNSTAGSGIMIDAISWS
ncbi:hypothetical protein ABIA54_000855 [Pseudomonas sp. EB276 TE3739]|uniref:hypothetical protein n=1 Tax=Pseudomonas TaxID=286 RepID=UPI0020A13071|nr:hypothetical protein [Pseudomonas koreensis]MCP1475053.1 hypothetical protein [Pseudomonas koreensis]